MQIGISGFDVKMSLGNNGVVLQVWDNQDNYLGKLRIGKATVEWCRGRTRIGNGVRVNWQELIDWFES